ncbi:uncharacterized protein HKW66_Vig0203720 [Vigna angularis]|uniref:Uncharacterized protein n=1 Tax=Phaseolus angularis TaxID=3914 RepID=A0A8T0JVV4_PHAAN|nr:uncharacterized protein HKW66_Vig0203720 [Vigna angularis]
MSESFSATTTTATIISEMREDEATSKVYKWNQSSSTTHAPDSNLTDRRKRSLLAMIADEGFSYTWFLDGNGSAPDDDKFCIDLEIVMSVLDEDTNPSEV